MRAEKSGEERSLAQAIFCSLRGLGARRLQKRPAARTIALLLALVATAILSLAASNSVGLAATLLFKAELSGGGEAPPNSSSGKAELNATLETGANTLAWTVSYSGLTGAPIGAHFHGPIAYTGLTPEESAPIQVGTPGNLASPFKGSTKITDAQAKDLKDGRWYFNIHTQKFPGGEVRGPIFRQ